VSYGATALIESLNISEVTALLAASQGEIYSW